MSERFMNIAVTPKVRDVQQQMGVDLRWQGRGGDEGFGEFEREFIAARDSFYIATVSETGWPYLQHRGGPKGFLQVIDDQTLAFADYRGNRQYLSTGNLAANDRACLFLMDYPHRLRLKVFAHVDTLSVDADPALGERLASPGYRAKVERIFRLKLEGFSWNCPQHITPRFTEEEIREAMSISHDH